MNDSKEKLKKIVKRVFLGHLIVLLFLAVNFKGFKKKKPIQKLALKENFRVVEKPKPPKKTPRVASQSKPAPSKKKEVKVAQKPKKKETLKLEKLKDLPPTPKESKPLQVPEALAKLSIEKEQTPPEEEHSESSEIKAGRYMEYLSAKIHEDLALGPHCFVTLELTLNREGKVLHIKHKKSSDPLSKDYIIENLSKMEFSHFFGEVVNQSEYTFVFTLKDPLL